MVLNTHHQTIHIIQRYNILCVSVVIDSNIIITFRLCAIHWYIPYSSIAHNLSEMVCYIFVFFFSVLFACLYVWDANSTIPQCRNVGVLYFIYIFLLLLSYFFFFLIFVNDIFCDVRVCVWCTWPDVHITMIMWPIVERRRPLALSYHDDRSNVIYTSSYSCVYNRDKTYVWCATTTTATYKCTMNREFVKRPRPFLFIFNNSASSFFSLNYSASIFMNDSWRIGQCAFVYVQKHTVKHTHTEQWQIVSCMYCITIFFFVCSFLFYNVLNAHSHLWILLRVSFEFNCCFWMNW